MSYRVGGEFWSKTLNYYTVITIIMDFNEQQTRQSFCSVSVTFHIILSFLFLIIIISFFFDF